MLKYFTAIRNILQTFGMFYDHLVHFGVILYIFFRFWYYVCTKKNLATLPSSANLHFVECETRADICSEIDF
jgi:Ni,Fe-hydrogenase I large subunit